MSHGRMILKWRGLSVFLLAVLFGCSKEPVASSTDSAATSGVRIVSLSPAISRTLIDFGLEQQIVGRTPFCESLHPGVAVVGSLNHIDYEMMVRLEPTHILVQPPSTGIDEALEKLAKEKGWRIGQWHLDTIDEIEQLIRELPGVLFTDNQPLFEKHAETAARLVSELASALSPGGGEVYQGRTLIITGVDPALAFGRGSYLHEILLAVGGMNATEAKGYPSLTLEDVVRLDPEAIILVKENAAVTVDPISALGPLAEADIDAIRNQRIAILSHPDASLPSSGIVGVAEALREILKSFAEDHE